MGASEPAIGLLEEAQAGVALRQTKGRGAACCDAGTETKHLVEALERAINAAVHQIGQSQVVVGRGTPGGQTNHLNKLRDRLSRLVALEAYLMSISRDR